ncbi:MAG: sugar-binding domain-containing protein [Frankiaceae bacterium]
MSPSRQIARPRPKARSTPRFSPQLMHAAATLYYIQDATQSEIAGQLGTSRPNVSRLLNEARRQGIVRIEVVAQTDPDDGELGQRAAQALGLKAVHVAPATHPTLIGTTLGPQLCSAVRDANLHAGDVLLVSAGRTVYEVAGAELPQLPGVLVTPMIGGQAESAAWYQTNEIVRQIAVVISGRPIFLYAPALPPPRLYERLVEDPQTRRVLDSWDRAQCAILGVGAPPLARNSLPAFMPLDTFSLGEAIGDVAARFYDRDGRPVPFSGDNCLIAIRLETLRAIPTTIAVAVGKDKVLSLVAAARAGYYKKLVTDVPTATALVEATDGKR